MFECMTSDGVLESKDGKQVLRFVRRFAHPVERVWKAITDPAELVGWLAEAEVDLDSGRIVLRWLNTDDQGNRAVMDSKITQLDPPTVLEYEGDPHGRLRWELKPDGNGTVLTFTAIGTFPPDQAALALAGWHWHLGALTERLGGAWVNWPDWPRHEWDVIYQRYLNKLG
jgi:uncharacterized protein YndB with AHSA1/START domain